jgi:hypothetical protein
MTEDLVVLQEQLDAQKRILEMQHAVLSNMEFVRVSLRSLAGELAGEAGKDWDELKAELGLEL